MSKQLELAAEERVVLGRHLGRLRRQGMVPANIEVDLSSLSEVGAVIRVGDLTVGPAVTIVTGHNDMVAGVHQKARAEKVEGVEETAEAAMTAPATLSAGKTG